jgi:transposase
MDVPKKTHKYTLNRRIEIVEEYELAERDLRGSVLRRYDITLATMARWRKQKREGLLEPSERLESRTALSRAERATFIHQEAKIAALTAELARERGAVDVLGKASALLESLAKSARPAPAEDSPEPPAWGQRYQR